MNGRSDLSDDDLSGPVIDRRTTIKLLGTAGMAGLAGCTGGGGGDGGGGPGDSGGDSGGSGGGSGSGGSGGGSGEASGPPSKDQTGGRLQAGWFTGSIDVLDPPYISVGQYFQVAANVFSGLVTLKKNLTVRGDLAKDWTVEGKGETIRFSLRKGVKFHNGDPFTAEDVKYTIQRTIENETPAAEKLATLKPVEEDGVVVENDSTVVLNFKQPMAPALIYLTRGPGRAATIVSKEAIEEMGREQYSITPVGTGPFQVTKHDVGSGITLDAFDEYFETDENGTQLPYLDGIDVKPIPEPATLVNAISGGDVQFTNLVPLENVDRVESASGVVKLQAPGVNWYGLAMNEERDPFSSKEARLGIAKLIDNEAFIRTAYFGNALSAQGPINKATEWVWRKDKPTDQAYAPEKGKQLVEGAGASGARFSILTTEDSLRAAKAMRQQLTNAGFDVSIDQVTSSTYWERYENLDYDTTISGSVGDPDPDQSLWNFYRKDGPWNWVAYEDDEVHQLLAKQRLELDRNQRAKTLQKLEDKLIADVPHAYLSHQDDIAARRESVKGFVHIPYMRNFHTVWLSG